MPPDFRKKIATSVFIFARGGGPFCFQTLMKAVHVYDKSCQLLFSDMLLFEALFSETPVFIGFFSHKQFKDNSFGP